LGSICLTSDPVASRYIQLILSQRIAPKAVRMLHRQSRTIIKLIQWIGLALVLALLPCTPACGDVVRLLDADEDALQSRIDLIQRARHEICFSYFCVGGDDTALGVLALVRDAARRGVKVHLLVDSMHNSMPKAVQAALIDDGVQIREYHPFRLDRPRWTLCRLHDKLLLADRFELITGGRNIEGRYFGHAAANYHDRDIYVRGQAAVESRRYFEEIWNSDDVSAVSASLSTGQHSPRGAARFNHGATPKVSREQLIEMANRSLEQHRLQLDKKPEVQLASTTDWAAGQYDVPGVRFLCDPLDGRKRDNDLTDELLRMFSSARESIFIESPYLYLTPLFRNALAAASERGVRVVILTNSLASTDVLIAQAGYESQRTTMQRLGFELYEFRGPRTLHSKSFLVDDRICVVGSFNLDPRSENRDTQVAILVDNPRFALVLKASIESDLAQADAASTNAVQLPVIFSDVPPERRLFFGVSRLFAPLLRGEL